MQAAGKEAERLFRTYKVYQAIRKNDELLEDVTADPEWQRLTDVDFITGTDEKPPIFHEVKEQAQQFTGGYYNITCEAISNEIAYKCKADGEVIFQFNRRADCNACSKHATCKEWGIVGAGFSGYPQKTVKAPANLQRYLIARGEQQKYRSEYYIKFGDGWLYKNPLVHADWYHIWLPFEDNNGREKAVVRDENYLEWAKTAEPDEKLIVRLPFDFFLSIRHDRLFELIEKRCSGKKGRLHQLPIDEILGEYRANHDGIVITPFVSAKDKNGVCYNEPVSMGRYRISKSLLEKSFAVYKDDPAIISVPIVSVGGTMEYLNFLANEGVIKHFEIDSNDILWIDILMQEQIIISQSKEFENSLRKRNETPTQIYALVLKMGNVTIDPAL